MTGAIYKKVSAETLTGQKMISSRSKSRQQDSGVYGAIFTLCVFGREINSIV